MAVDSFLEHFTLTPEDAEFLQSRDIHIGMQFFQIMRKAEIIINDSRVLMTKSCRVRRLTVLSTSSRIMTTSFLFCTQHRHRHNHVPAARTRLRQDRALVHPRIPAIRARRAARSDALDGARRQMAAQEVRAPTQRFFASSCPCTNLH